MAPKNVNRGIPRVVPEIRPMGTATKHGPTELGAWNRPPSIVGLRCHACSSSSIRRCCCSIGILSYNWRRLFSSSELSCQSAQCQADPLSIWVVWICLVRILLELLGGCVQSAHWGQSPADGSSAIGEAARADSCLCVWQDGSQIVSWTDLMKEVELCNIVQLCIWIWRGLGTNRFDLTDLANDMGNRGTMTRSRWCRQRRNCWSEL